MSIAEISELIGLIATGLGLIVAIVGWVKTFVKNLREKKLKELVEELMALAEKSGLSGAEKKDLVLTELLKEVKNLGGDYEKIIEQASKYIEECIEFSKKINSK